MHWRRRTDDEARKIRGKVLSGWLSIADHACLRLEELTAVSRCDGRPEQGLRSLILATTNPMKMASAYSKIAACAYWSGSSGGKPRLTFGFANTFMKSPEARRGMQRAGFKPY